MKASALCIHDRIMERETSETSDLLIHSLRYFYTVFNCTLSGQCVVSLCIQVAVAEKREKEKRGTPGWREQNSRPQKSIDMDAVTL